MLVKGTYACFQKKVRIKRNIKFECLFFYFYFFLFVYPKKCVPFFKSQVMLNGFAFKNMIEYEVWMFYFLVLVFAFLDIQEDMRVRRQEGKTAGACEGF